MIEENPNFTENLFQAIEERRNWFDTIELPKLLDTYRAMQGLTETVFAILLKKGVITEDPYKKDKKISDIVVPPDTPYSDNEQSVIIGMRLSDYESMLDFLCNYFKFSVSFLTLDRIKALVALNNCFHWNGIAPTSPKPNTRGLARMFQGIKQSTDILSAGMINDSISQMSKNTAAANTILKELTDFQKELYKADIRKGILANPQYSESKAAAGTDAVIQQIRKLFPSVFGKKPFYTELIEEIAQEECGPDKENRRKQLIDKLRVSKTSAAVQEQQVNTKEMLMDGVRIISGAAPQFEIITEKLEENRKLLQSQNSGFRTKFAAILRKAYYIEEKKLEYTVSITESGTQIRKSQVINYADLLTELNQKIRFFNLFSVKKSQGYAKVEAQTEQQILDFLNKQMSETQSLLVQLAALDEYFKTNASPTNRTKVKGIKIELAAIKNTLIKTNQCRAEYISIREEQEQLKRLGINNA